MPRMWRVSLRSTRSLEPFPRHVLANTLTADEEEMGRAVQDCSLDCLTSCFADSGTAPKQMSHRLTKVTTTDYSEGPIRFASAAIQDQLAQKFLRQNNHSVRAFLASSGGVPAMVAFRGYLLEATRVHAHDILPREGDLRCRNLQTCEEIAVTLPPSKSTVHLPNYAAISKFGKDVYGQGKDNLGGIDAMVNTCLFQIAVSHTQPIKLGSLLSIEQEAGGLEGLKLFFAVDPHAFTSIIDKQSIAKKKGEV